MFCALQKDVKTYSYFKRYVEFFEKNSDSLEIDNQIQAEEIASHLFQNGFQTNNEAEKLKWIIHNGKPFREYLNTIKLIVVFCKTMNLDAHKVSSEEFDKLEERLNAMRHCLGSIY